MQTEGAFRVRRHDDGGIELWAPGWRLETRFLSLVPAGLAVGFAMSSIFLPVRLLGCGALLGAAFVLHRLTSIAIRVGPAGVTFVDVLKTRSIPWSEVVAFMGERTRHDGHVVLLCRDGSRLRAPGSLTGEELNPIGDEGDLSAVDQLNRITERLRRSIPAAAAVGGSVSGGSPGRSSGRSSPVATRRPKRRARGPVTRPRPVEPPAPAPAPVRLPEAQEQAGLDGEPEAVPAAMRYPHVPRPPAPEPERISRREMRRRLKRVGDPSVVHVPEAEPMSPGARRLAELERRTPK